MDESRLSGNPFERYADDAIIHCRTRIEAGGIKDALAARMKECRLELHPEKTNIVYCKDDKRKSCEKVTQFDFLGFTFRMRTVSNPSRKVLFNGFCPAISLKAKRKIMNEIKNWKVYKRSHLSIFEIADFCNPKIRGWIGYYGKFYRSELYGVFKQFNTGLLHWAQRKYKKIGGGKRRAIKWLETLAASHPNLFEHWKLEGVRTSTIR